MLDLKAFKKNPDLFLKQLARRGTKWEREARSLRSLITEANVSRQKVEELQAQLNKKSKAVPTLPGEQKKELLIELKRISDDITNLNVNLKAAEHSIEQNWKLLPNLPADDVKDGQGEPENEVIRTVGKIPVLKFKPLDHLELGKKLDLIDTETAGLVSGSRFGYLKNEAVLLQFALIQLGLSVLANENQLKKIIRKNKLAIPPKAFVPIIPPVMIKEEILNKMARLEPREERYHLPQDNLYLVGSAEHTMGPLHMNQIIPEKTLPLRYVGYSTAFRREAGSYGKDTRGIFRVHQFDKLEMETFTLPEHSIAEQDFIVAIQEYLVQLLELPYRVVKMCTGDMTAPDARQIDIEIWLPSQQRYRETHTSDLTTDYQARRLDIRYQKNDGTKGIVHMNDATVFAVGRTLIAIMENCQLADGSIKIPKVLQPYLHGLKIIERK